MLVSKACLCCRNITIIHSMLYVIITCPPEIIWLIIWVMWINHVINPMIIFQSPGLRIQGLFSGLNCVAIRICCRKRFVSGLSRFNVLMVWVDGLVCVCVSLCVWLTKCTVWRLFVGLNGRLCNVAQVPIHVGMRSLFNMTVNVENMGPMLTHRRHICE